MQKLPGGDGYLFSLTIFARHDPDNLQYVMSELNCVQSGLQAMSMSGWKMKTPVDINLSVLHI